MTEAQLQDAVIELAIVLGWRVHHQRPARTARGWRSTIQGHAGLPDLILVKRFAHRSRALCIVAELKSERGKVSAEQAEWLSGFSEVSGVQCFVWRPEHWRDGFIEKVLRADSAEHLVAMVAIQMRREAVK